MKLFFFFSVFSPVPPFASVCFPPHASLNLRRASFASSLRFVEPVLPELRNDRRERFCFSKTERLCPSDGYGCLSGSRFHLVDNVPSTVLMCTSPPRAACAYVIGADEKMFISCLWKIGWRTFTSTRRSPSWAAVCSRLSFFTNTDALTIVYTSRNRYLDFLSGGSISCTTAGGTFLFDHLTCAAAFWTCLYITDHTEHRLLRINNLSLSVTFRTGNRLCSRLCSGSVTGGAFILQNNFQFLFTAKYSLFKSNVYSCSKVCAAHRAIIGTSSASAAKQISENISENVSHICAVKVKTAEAAGSASAVFKGRVTKLVILLSFIRVA